MNFMYKFFYCKITHIPTGDSFVVQSYETTPENALKWKRLTWANKSLWDIEVLVDSKEEKI